MNTKLKKALYESIMKSIAKSVKGNLNEMAARSDKSILSGLSQAIISYCKENNIDPDSPEIKKALGNLSRKGVGVTTTSQTYILKYQTVGYHSINRKEVKCKASNIENAIEKLAKIYTEDSGEKRGDAAYIFDLSDNCVAIYKFTYKSGIGFGAWISNNSYEAMSDINNWELY